MCSVTFISTPNGVMLACVCGWSRWTAFGPRAFLLERAHVRGGLGYEVVSA